MEENIIGKTVSCSEAKVMYQEAIDKNMSRMQLALVKAASVMDDLEEVLALGKSPYPAYPANEPVALLIRNTELKLRAFVVLVHPENLKGAQMEFQNLCNAFEESVIGPKKDENLAGRVVAQIGRTICQIAGDYI
jgi:hypothetical protein